MDRRVTGGFGTERLVCHSAPLMASKLLMCLTCQKLKKDISLEGKAQFLQRITHLDVYLYKVADSAGLVTRINVVKTNLWIAPYSSLVFFRMSSQLNYSSIKTVVESYS